MKKISIVLAVFLVMLSLITISYASFVIEGSGSLTTNLNTTKINVANIITNDYSFVRCNSSSGLSYYTNNDGTRELVNTDAKVTLNVTILRDNYQTYVAYFRDHYFYFKLDISSNNFLQNLNPIAYLSYSTYTAYFTLSYVDNSLVGMMPITSNNVFSNDYFDYIASKTISNMNCAITIDFSNSLSNQKVYVNNNAMSLELGTKEVA